MQANYENDRNIRKIFRLVNDKNSAVISRLPPPILIHKIPIDGPTAFNSQRYA